MTAEGLAQPFRKTLERNDVRSMRPFDLRATYDAGAGLAAGLRVAKRKYVIIHELAVEVTVGIDDDHGSVVSSCQLADHWLPGALPITRNGLDAPEPTTLLSRDLDYKIFLEQPRLLQRSPCLSANDHRGQPQ